MLRFVYLLVGLLVACRPVLALPIEGIVHFSPGIPSGQGVAYILEDTPDNRLAVGRMAQAIEYSDGLRRRLQARTVQRLNSDLQEAGRAQARLQGQLNRMVTMARARAVATVPVADGTFAADVPFERQLVVVVAQSNAHAGWWLQSGTADLPFSLGPENALFTRDLPGASGEPAERR